MIYLISYDPTQPNKEAYAPLVEAINKYDCIQVQESVWLISTDEQPRFITDKLAKTLPEKDTSGSLEPTLGDSKGKTLVFVNFKDITIIGQYPKAVLDWFTSHTPLNSVPQPSQTVAPKK